MAALRKIGRLSSLLLSRSSRVYSSCPPVPPPSGVIENNPPWPELWLPGPFPKTEEERRKAAEKYGLHPDEYQPQDSETDACGDYPKLPRIGYDARDPYYPWDIPSLRRNFNEVLHEDEDIMGVDKYSSYGVKDHENDSFDALVGWAVFLSALGIFYFGFSDSHARVMEKQYLQRNVKRYTFDPLSK